MAYLWSSDLNFKCFGVIERWHWSVFFSGEPVEVIHLSKTVIIDVDRRIIYSNQIMTKAQMSIDWWIGKDTVCIYNGLLLSHKKEWGLAICNNMDCPRGYKAE